MCWFFSLWFSLGAGDAGLSPGLSSNWLAVSAAVAVAGGIATRNFYHHRQLVSRDMWHGLQNLKLFESDLMLVKNMIVCNILFLKKIYINHRYVRMDCFVYSLGKQG